MKGFYSHSLKQNKTLFPKYSWGAVESFLDVSGCFFQGRETAFPVTKRTNYNPSAMYNLTICSVYTVGGKGMSSRISPEGGGFQQFPITIQAECLTWDICSAVSHENLAHRRPEVCLTIIVGLRVAKGLIGSQSLSFRCAVWQPLVMCQDMSPDLTFVRLNFWDDNLPKVQGDNLHCEVCLCWIVC